MSDMPKKNIKSSAPATAVGGTKHKSVAPIAALGGGKPKEVDFRTATMKKKTPVFRATKEQLKPIRESLPIFEHRAAVMDTIAKNTNLILVGETGSGKTTQIPQYLYEDGYARKGMIGITQPRRVAAMTVADRVAQEVGVDLGTTVGYTIRFDDMSDPSTKIKYLTDGMLLREIQVDPMLSRYSVIILDEAHERTLNTDILFGLLKRLQNTKRPDLKVIAMSATLDAGKFSSYFNNAPVALIPGRTFKVDIFFAEEPQTDTIESCAVTALQIHQTRPLDGDILIFMAGSDDIEAVKQTIEDRSMMLDAAMPKIIVYPLYSTLSPEQQLKAFEKTPDNTRKIVIATNIAETSITLSGIKYVIDTGLAKIKTFSPTTGMEMLCAEPISQAESFQRSGRSGREREGECFRLYTEDTFHTLQVSIQPEILRCSLTAAVLQLKALGVDNVQAFDFIDKPSKAALKQAVLDLIALNALDMQGHITPLGIMMNEFPLEPCYARVLIASALPQTAGADYVALLNRDKDSEGHTASPRKHIETLKRSVAPETLVFQPCSDEMCTLIAALSVENLLVAVNKSNRILNAKLEGARRKFMSMEGDMIMLYEIISKYMLISDYNRKQWCLDNFVNFRNANMILKVRQQLIDTLQRMDMEIVSCVEQEHVKQASQLGQTVDSQTQSSMAVGGVSGADVGGVHGHNTLSHKVNPLDNLRKALITGLFGHVAFRQYDGKYKTVDGTQVFIHPSSIINSYTHILKQHMNSTSAANSVTSGNGKNIHAAARRQLIATNTKLLQGEAGEFQHPHQVMLYHSLVRTAKNYMRDLVSVNEEWLHLVNPTYFKEHTSQNGAAGPDATHDSHNNTLIKGQRTAFSNLTSKTLSNTVSLASGKSNLAKKPRVEENADSNTPRKPTELVRLQSPTSFVVNKDQKQFQKKKNAVFNTLKSPNKSLPWMK